VIDLNRAGREELLLLPGVGEGLAGRIEDYRRERGGFRNVQELTHVTGVGATTLERLRPLVRVHPEDAAGPAGSAVRPGAGADPVGTIDINAASAGELDRLPGIGPKLAQRIVQERAKGPFTSVEDLRRVSGIGPKTVERLRPHVSAGGLAVRPAEVD
jgi:competence protein ComEA